MDVCYCKAAWTATMRNEKLVIPILMQYFISVFGFMYRNTSYFAEKHIATFIIMTSQLKTFRYIRPSAHMTASTEGDCSLQNYCIRMPNLTHFTVGDTTHE